MKRIITLLVLLLSVLIGNTQIVVPAFQAVSTVQNNPIKIIESDGSSLAGWTLTDASTAVDANIGNNAPSFKVTARGFYKDLGINFLNKTIKFDIRIAAGADVGIGFVNNAAGNSAYRATLRLRQGAGSLQQGLSFIDNGGWLYIGANGGLETTTIFTNTNTWYAITLQITSEGVCTWYVNNIKQASSVTINAGYTKADNTNTYFGFITNTSTAYFDNLEIWSGLK
jgi:hypothetical protein